MHTWGSVLAAPVSSMELLLHRVAKLETASHANNSPLDQETCCPMLRTINNMQLNLDYCKNNIYNMGFLVRFLAEVFLCACSPWVCVDSSFGPLPKTMHFSLNGDSKIDATPVAKGF